MYLTRINPETGLVDISDTKDGVLAIPAFRKIIQLPEFGIECFTCVALTMDYETPLHNFATHERHLKAMYQIMGKKDAFNWALDDIQNCCIVYDDLQYNDDLMEERLLLKRRKEIIAEIDITEDDLKRTELYKKSREIRNLLKEYSKQDRDETISEYSPVINGYTLSRLENKINNKNSFYHAKERLSRSRESVESEND